MATVVIMPKLGLTMTEGTIGKWIKQEGDSIEKGEPLVEIITDKVNFEYEAPASGILRKILHREGDVLPVTTPIAIIAAEGEPLPEIQMKEPEITVAEPVHVTVDAQVKETPKRIFVSPLAKRMAREKGIDLSSLEGSGPQGRILKVDILKAEEKLVAEKAGTSSPLQTSSGKLVPLTRIRKIIAKRMTESFQNIPHIYFSVEVDMSAVLDLREKLRGEIEKRAKVRLTVTDILAKVAASALREYPIINSRIDGDQIHMIEEINVGVAMALSDGLIVPVLHHADRKSLAEIAVTLRDLTQKAKEGTLSLEEVEGGTFTLSNMGMLGIDKFNAIINPPECSILGVGRTVERPVVQGGEITIRPMAWFNLSSDHRIIDGAGAALFLAHVKKLAENPTLLLI